MAPFGDFCDLGIVATCGLAGFCGPFPIDGVRAEEVLRAGTWAPFSYPSRGTDFCLDLVHNFED